jgi:hypothetical protein
MDGEISQDEKYFDDLDEQARKEAEAKAAAGDDAGDADADS